MKLILALTVLLAGTMTAQPHHHKRHQEPKPAPVTIDTNEVSITQEPPFVASVSEGVRYNGRVTYTLEFADDWTCRPSAGSLYPTTLITMICVKSDAPKPDKETK
jgi:hypothetical protein